MDGVLADSEDFMAQAAVEMFARDHHCRVDERDFFPFRGMGEDRYLGGVAEKYGIKLLFPDAKTRAYAIYLELIKGRLQPLPGVLSFVADCRARGLKLAVATSADRMKLIGTLAEIGLPLNQFDALVTGTEIKNKKPDPEIFLTAAKQIGLTNERCLVIEDANSGVRAAKAAGSRCLALTTSLDAASLLALGADWVAKDLSEVPADLWEN